MKTISTLPLLFCLLLAGCVVPQQTIQPTSRTFTASRDKVWPLLVSEVGLDYPVKAVEKDSGLITTDFVSVPVGFNNSGMEQWVIPPHGFLYTWAGLRMTISAMIVDADAGRTQVTLRTHYEAFENNVSKSWLTCQSNGNLENQILDKVSSRLNSQNIIEANPVAK